MKDVMVKVYVIAPDKSSGLAFCEVLKKQSISAEFNYHVISPRVFNNKITESNDVLNDLNEIFKNFKDKTKSVVIACNTLQLWLDDIDEEYKKNVKVYTTFEACEWKYKNFKVKPLWLGTTPLVEKTTNFPTFVSLKEPQEQDKVQELIWRIKMLEGDDYATAPQEVKDDANDIELQKEKIKNLKKEILDSLKRLGVTHVISGCTELPLVFKKEKEFGIKFIDPATVLSEYIKYQSVAIIFAGGTISSIADDRGVRVSGKEFELLEKLNLNASGSYKNLNVTKSEIVYSGFSENMTSQHHHIILNSVNAHLNVGYSRIVITHGTDSMEQTARFLHKKIGNKLKKSGITVVLTGSNDHIDHDFTDAWDNLRFSINHEHSSLQGGVYVGFANKMIPGDEVVKMYSIGKPMSYTSKFSSEYRTNVIAFQNIVKDFNNKLERKLKTTPELEGIMEYDANDIRKNHDFFLKEVDRIKPKVVLFKLYHSGTANTLDKKSSIADLIEYLNKKDIICLCATENGEPTDLHLYETSLTLENSGLIPLYDMLYPVALHKLRLLNIRKNQLEKNEIIDEMLNNYVGEINQLIS